MVIDSHTLTYIQTHTHKQTGAITIHCAGARCKQIKVLAVGWSHHISSSEFGNLARKQLHSSTHTTSQVPCPAERCKLHRRRFGRLAVTAVCFDMHCPFYVPGFTKTYSRTEKRVAAHRVNIRKQGHVINCWNKM